MEVELIETEIFTRKIRKLLSEEAYRKLQYDLAEKPGSGAIIKGSGGIRKTRVSPAGSGKSGGARIIYYWGGRTKLDPTSVCVFKERGFRFDGDTIETACGDS